MTNPRASGHPAPAIRRRERPRLKTEAQVPAPSPVPDQSYEVGYGKPPKQSQFKAGQSGNPKGRPKGARSLFALLREDLHRKVQLGENGKVTTVTRAEAVVRRVVADTLGGKASQTRLLFSLLETLEAQDAAVPEDRSLSKADAELIGNLLKGFADE